MNKHLILTPLCAALLSLSTQAQNVMFAAQKGKGGKATNSSAVVIDDKGTLATVVEIGSDAEQAKLSHDGKTAELKLIARDADSRVAIYEIPSEARAWIKPTALGSSHTLKPAQPVYTSATDRSKTSSYVSRINRFQGKVLPLAVLRLNHPGAAPTPGTGIYDAGGKLIGITRQSVYNAPNSSYCLPVEVITRIHQDQKRNNRVRRCWCGIIMDKLVATPIVESVRPDSPAAKAGILKGDVILRIANQPVSEYAEVVDAFYYLIAGQPTKFQVLRGTKTMEFNVSPEVNPGS